MSHEPQFLSGNRQWISKHWKFKVASKLFNATIDKLISEENIKVKEDLDIKRSKVNHYIAFADPILSVVCIICLFFIRNVNLHREIIKLQTVKPNLYIVAHIYCKDFKKL